MKIWYFLRLLVHSVTDVRYHNSKNSPKSGYPCTLMYHWYLATERLVKKNKYILRKLINQIIGIYFISCGITTGPTTARYLRMLVYDLRFLGGHHMMYIT